MDVAEHPVRKRFTGQTNKLLQLEFASQES